jgi:hypothetical protein
LGGELLEERAHRLERLGPVRGLLRHHLLDEGRELLRNQRVEVAQARHGRRQVLHHEADRRARGVRQPAREQLEGHHAERVDVGAGVGGLGARLLRSHVVGRSHDERRRGHRRRGDARRGALGEAEVEQLEKALAVIVTTDEEVGGLEVAVDDARLVRRGERAGRLQEEPHDLGERELPLAVDEVAERLAVQQLHDEVRTAIGREAMRVDVDDAAVANGVDGLRLGQHAAHEHLVARELGLDDLDGDALVDDRVQALVHDAHAAFAERADDQVVAELRAEEQVTNRRRIGVRSVSHARAPSRHYPSDAGRRSGEDETCVGLAL